MVLSGPISWEGEGGVKPDFDKFHKGVPKNVGEILYFIFSGPKYFCESKNFFGRVQAIFWGV